MGADARGYSWPPFEAGNLAAVKHGADSETRWRPLAGAIAAEVVGVAPWLGSPLYAASVSAWARAEAAVVLIHGWLDERGPIDDDGAPRPAETALRQWEARAERARERLGLSPLDHGRLLAAFAGLAGHADADAALESLAAEGRRILEARAELDAGSRDHAVTSGPEQAPDQHVSEDRVTTGHTTTGEEEAP